MTSLTRGICSPSPPPERQTTAGWFKVRANEAVWPDMSGLGEADQWGWEHHFAPQFECKVLQWTFTEKLSENEQILRKIVGEK